MTTGDAVTLFLSLSGAGLLVGLFLAVVLKAID